MADRRRAHRAAAAGLTAACLLVAGGCGGGESTASPDRVLTVEEALRVDADGPIRVRGTLIAGIEGVRLCSAILESYPPQCGQPALRVRGLDVLGFANMEEDRGISWSRREVTLVGTVDDGTLSVTR